MSVAIKVYRKWSYNWLFSRPFYLLFFKMWPSGYRDCWIIRICLIFQRTEKTALNTLRIIQKRLLTCPYKYPCMSWLLGNENSVVPWLLWLVSHLYFTSPVLRNTRCLWPRETKHIWNRMSWDNRGQQISRGTSISWPFLGGIHLSLQPHAGSVFPKREHPESPTQFLSSSVRSFRLKHCMEWGSQKQEMGGAWQVLTG